MGSTSPVSVDKEDSQTPIITWPKDAETQVVEVTNPCPAGYRLPTEAELDAERQSWSSDNAAGAFASPLKLPLGGYRRYGDGSLAEVGSRAFYWPDTKDGTNSRYLTFSIAGASMHGFERNIYLHKVDIIKAAGIF